MIHAGQTLTVIVRSRDAEYFNGKAVAVSSTNQKGPFDVLPKHTHFISLIQNSITIHKTDTSTQKIIFSNAILKVKDDMVEVYISMNKEK
ncbi:MAG: hypothetical protein A2719_01140 [Candidatus Ryanbacteria bacterium RIFCSPHIGHO2_01_FULL_45_22]|uniref:ATP synthase F1 complex delta/epsilon subunit N-terminal domain-containing protein n=2 Tax=Candidatus Ryaniibacteriota TaxID=1817914 RepID=A0A1G2G112_9BACT|nr:MAG: hypothetical protein A2719_01140 [Candidatus Ryanbacteria bacterium RIFCSPHIGHO2_01_FULL_45_22]OGZ46335.1 MAG: hypothetical protein A3J54_04025 [Candidatus Ryanbacteria bacterium RIFCSPHIGHO2_02_FULL_45_13b]